MLDDLSCQRQPKACALEATRCTRLKLLELSEQATDVRLGYTDPGVLD